MAPTDEDPDLGLEGDTHEIEDPVLDCPTCGEVTDHVVMRAATAGWTVQCQECHVARNVPAPRQMRMTRVPVILSEGATARSAMLHVPLDEPVCIDDEFELDGHRVRVTQVEKADGSRPKAVPGREVRTLYAVIFDTVRLRYTLNQGEVTRSFDEEAVPEEEIHVGAIREVQGVRLHIKALKSDQNRTLNRGYLLARNVRRIFADEAPTGTEPGQHIRPRHRGPSPWTVGKKLGHRGKS